MVELSKMCLYHYDDIYITVELMPLLESNGYKGTVEFSVICPVCKEPHPIKCSLKGLKDYYNGEYIQVALHELDADMREMLISGVCPDCWLNMFGEDDE